MQATSQKVYILVRKGNTGPIPSSRLDALETAGTSFTSVEMDFAETLLGFV